MTVRTPDAEVSARTEPGADRAGPRWTAPLRLPWRLSRRGGALMWATAAVYVLIEVVSYRSTYPDAASRERLAQVADSGAVRALQGVPRAVDTVGGFVVWDAGWFLSLIVAIWALLVTTRLLRAEEDKGHAEVVLATPVRPGRLLVSQLSVVAAILLVFGLTVGLTMTALDVPAGGSFLFGLGLTGVGLVMVGAAALAAQLFEVRRRAVAATSGLVGLAFLLRAVGNSVDGTEWLLRTTPFGWLDRLEPFAVDRWTGLLPFALLFAVLLWLSVHERAVRDIGAGRLAGRDRREPRTALLSGPVAFGWRLTTGLLLAWAAGLAVFGAVMGSLVSTIVDLFEEDDTYTDVLAELGYDVSDATESYLSIVAVLFALVFALYVSWRIGALRAEEGSERLEHLLVRGVVRWRWLSASAALSLLAATLVVLATGAGVWAGAAVTGADVGVGQAFGPLLATLPVVVLFGGLAVLAFGAVPRLTVAVPVTAAVLAYLLDLLGPVLDCRRRCSTCPPSPGCPGRRPSPSRPGAPSCSSCWECSRPP
jgi:ABC-2 type transport system permease protein